MSYVSEISVREAISDRERYIRVAAIDITIIEGIWNICGGVRSEWNVTLGANENTQGRTRLIFTLQ